MTTENTPAKNWFKRHPYLAGIGGFILFIIIISALSGSNKSAQQTASSNQNQEEASAVAIKISANKLVQAYLDNEVNADNLYKGKLLEISGTIKDISKDILDAPYVIIESDPSDYFTQIQCMFGKSDEVELAKLKKGSTITVQGNGSGKLMNVLVQNCSILR